MKNKDQKVINDFGNEWKTYNQRDIDSKEIKELFNHYFSIFPFDKINTNSEGFDMGCGSGRWAKFIAPKVRLLHCIDPSRAIQVAKKKLKKFNNVSYHRKSLEKSGLKSNSQDFGYSLGVLHHVPHTNLAIKTCVKLLKPGAPFLLYIYYSFDNRPYWFKFLWNISNFIRLIINKLPKFLKFIICDFIAVIVYFPLSRFIFFLEKFGLELKKFPLYFYRSKSFYVMRTDSRDRFGTPLEKRFSKKEIHKMMKESGLHRIKFKNNEPFWTVIGFKKY